MNSIAYYADSPLGLSDGAIRGALEESLSDVRGSLRRVLLLPPDYTRFHSCAGKITNFYYHLLKDVCEVDVMPALGTHVPMTEFELTDMFGDIPLDRYLVHNWRDDVVDVGVVPAEFVREVSEGVYDKPIPAQINKRLLDGYDLILSIGQVVPHEVVGMANYTKNLMVGVGGRAMINASHIVGAFYGMERMMGRDHTPVRRIFDYCEQNFLRKLPLRYVQTVTTAKEREIFLHGLFIGDDRAPFENAVALAQQTNMTLVDKTFKKVVVMLDAQEFKSTWLGNKSVYRTRMAISDGGELIVLAPGVDKFGEDPGIDALIRKYGYTGRSHIIDCCNNPDCADLQGNMSAAAHLIHGSSDGRFSITYCTTHLTRKEIESVGYNYLPYDEAAALYTPAALTPGWNTLPTNEEIYYIPNPALGLWADRAKF